MNQDTAHTANQDLIQMTISLDHAKALSKLIDLGVRIHLGQFGEIADLANMGEIKARTSSRDDTPRELSEAEIAELRQELNDVRAIFGHLPNSSFGVGHRGTSDQAKRVYEIKKVIDKALQQHLRPDERHTVDSDGLLVRYSTDIAPTAVVIKGR